MPAIYTCDICGRSASEDEEGRILCPYHEAEQELKYLHCEYNLKKKWLEETHLLELSKIRDDIKVQEDWLVKNPLS